jgi:hypothetical protein
VRRIVCHFNKEEQERYWAIEKEPRAKLTHVLETGQVVWNRKCSCQLMLYCVWLDFYHINSDMMANSVPKWKASNNLLYDIVRAVWKKTHKDPKHCFTCPERDDVAGLLTRVCTGSPKIRALLRIVAELVVVQKKKVLIWVALPAVQLLLLGIFRALGIDAIAYTADLNMKERNDATSAFNKEKDKAMILIGTFDVGSAGLNLQYLCHYAVFFDSAPNRGMASQASGRLWRMNQKETVVQFEMTMDQTFQSYIVTHTLQRSLPGVMAELSLPMTLQKDASGETHLVVGDWYLIDGRLVSASDPEAEDLPPTQKKLTPKELITAIVDLQGGVRELAEDEADWVSEEAQEGDVDQEKSIAESDIILIDD